MQGHGILPTILADANKRLGGEDENPYSLEHIDKQFSLHLR